MNVLERVHSAIDKGGSTGLSLAVQPLRDAGVKPNMHVGDPKESFAGNPQKVIEWYAGSILDIADNEAFFAVNSWLNYFHVIREQVGG